MPNFLEEFKNKRNTLSNTAHEISDEIRLTDKHISGSSTKDLNDINQTLQESNEMLQARLIGEEFVADRPEEGNQLNLEDAKRK